MIDGPGQTFGHVTLIPIRDDRWVGRSTRLIHVNALPAPSLPFTDRRLRNDRQGPAQTRAKKYICCIPLIYSVTPFRISK